jgi:hypothetical protein
MIDRALRLLADRLNGHLKGLYNVPDDLVAVSPLTDAEGKPADQARNRLALFVTNVSHDAMPRAGQRPGVSLAGSMRKQLPIHLDIYVMLAASFEPETYAEGLKLLSSAMRYFQGHPLMTPQTHPEMPTGLAQLTLEISNLSNDALGQLWGNLGGRYVPSVQYKLRSVMIDSDTVVTVDPIVTTPRARAGQAAR